MLKNIILSNFQVRIRDYEGNKDYNMEVYFEPRTAIEQTLGHFPMTIPIPYKNGIIDTTINENDYECIISMDDDKTNQIVKDVQFRRKLRIGSQNIDPKESAKVSQFLDTSVAKEFRKVASPDGNSYITISDDIVEIVSGETKFTISKNQITSHCKTVDNNLPSSSKGLLFTETGILRFLPKCFIPPFSVPDYIPDVTLVLKAAKILEIFKNFTKIF